MDYKYIYDELDKIMEISFKIGMLVDNGDLKRSDIGGQIRWVMEIINDEANHIRLMILEDTKAGKSLVDISNIEIQKVELPDEIADIIKEVLGPKDKDNYKKYTVPSESVEDFVDTYIDLNKIIKQHSELCEDEDCRAHEVTPYELREKQIEMINHLVAKDGFVAVPADFTKSNKKICYFPKDNNLEKLTSDAVTGFLAKNGFKVGGDNA